MWFLGYLATYFAAAVVGLYLNELLSNFVLFSRLGYEGEKKWDKSRATLRLLKHASSAFGVGAAAVAFLHALPWAALGLIVILGSVTPVFLFFVYRVGLKTIFHWKVLTIIALVTLPLIVLSVDKDVLRLIVEVFARIFWAVVIYMLLVKCIYFVFDSLTGYKDKSEK